MLAVEVRDKSQVAEARRIAVGLAKAHGFGEDDAGRVAIVTSELATNMVKHGKAGTLLVGSYEDSTGSGIECLALDKGDGIPDIDAAMRDGFSTAGSPGTGLGAVARVAHAHDIYSVPGMGTAILARLEVGRPHSGRQAALSDYGAVSIAVAGEDACGDTWCRKADHDGFSVMVADGLGHGPFAAQAAHAASHSFQTSGEDLPSQQLVAMHAALRSTRGAAVGIAKVDHGARQVLFSGVGNIAATIVNGDFGVRRLVSNNGTVGHNARTIRDFSYPLDMRAVLILASDGIGTSWRLDHYPGLSQRHPTLIAGVLYRDFTRGRDDATVFVARTEPA